jgi:peptide chain release factor subunit 1
MLSRAELDSLQGFKSDDQQMVVSLYLDVDGSRFPNRTDYEAELKSMIRNARKTMEGEPVLGREQAAALDEELTEISRYISIDFRRDGARGLALFACRPAGLWQPLPLGIQVTNSLSLDWQPRVSPLAEIMARHRNLGVLVTNKERARIFHSFAGEIEERTEILDQVPGHHEQGGWGQSKLQRWHDLEVREHLKRACDAMLDLFKREHFEALILAVPDELKSDLDRVMHQYLKERITGSFTVDINAGVDEIKSRVAEIESGQRKAEEAELLGSLSAELSAGKSYVGGLDDVLAALNQRRVEILIVEAGFTEPGRRCHSCNSLTFSEETCPSCNIDAEPTQDIVDDARESAIRQAAVIFTVEPGHPAMQQAGGIAAKLRY